MTDYNWCHGPRCHTKSTQSRIRGSGTNKVLRTRKIKVRENFSDCHWWQGWENHFCKLGCLMDFIREHLNDVIALGPRRECLETPINDPVKTRHSNSYHSWYDTEITVDESRR